MKTITGNKTTKEWDKVRIGDALRLINGRAFKPSEWRGKGLPIVRIQNLNNAEAPFNYYEGHLPEKFLLNNGDLLFAWSGTPGTSFGAHIWRGGKAWLNQHIFKVLFNETDFNKKFLELAINQNLNEYIRAAHGGAGLAHITKGRFEQSELLKPTIDEQRDIVAEIEKQFSRLDEAVANLKRVKANLKRYRASVLKTAVEGKLTEVWRKQHPDVEPVSKLLDRILSERHAKWSGKGKYKEPEEPDTTDLPPLTKGWTWARVEQLGVTFGGLTKNPKRAKFTKKLPYLRVANVYANELRLDEIEYIGVQVSELDKLLLHKGDLLVVEGNGSKSQIGRLAIWDGSIDPCVHQNHLIKVRLVVDSMNKWILFWLLSPVGRHFIEEVSNSTSGLYTLSVNKVGDLPVVVPSLAEQERIVAEVERRLSFIEELEAVVRANLTRAARLRQSILQRAFRGELHIENKSHV